MQYLMRINALSVFLVFFLIICTFSNRLQAQSCPEQGTVIFPGLVGQDLLDALVAEYKTTTVQGYDLGRDIMYSIIDNDNGTVTGIYTGYTITLDPESDPSSDAYSKGIDAEHTWPQSKGASGNAKSDLHALHPSRSSANGSRGNHPFAEISDNETVSWWRNDEKLSTPDYNFIDEYSERKEGHYSGYNHPGSNEEYDSWEPREAVKGDVARGMFYFYTMYKNQADAADPYFFEVQKQDLRSWNQIDTVSSKEYDRTCAIAPYQDNKVNPFVIDPTLVERAFFEGQLSETTVEFASSEIIISEGQGSIEIQISINNANADTATTVDIAYSASSATAGSDFETFTTKTVTFPEGSFSRETVTLNILDDDEVEEEESIILSLQNVNGPQNVSIGTTNSVEIIIQDNDGETPSIVWINEFHYDNDGTDTGEFIELAVDGAAADLSTLTLTLYNGSNGQKYGEYSGSEFIQGDTENGFTFYYLDFPANGLQNGGPDGMSLHLDNKLVQFLSYEGTMTAADAAAEGVQSEDIGVEQSGSEPIGSSLSLSGSGNSYGDFKWQKTDANTKGSLNTNQIIEENGDGEESPVVTFKESLLSVFEDEGQVLVEVQISNPDQENVTSVDVLVTGGSATTEDYTAFDTQNLVFPAGSDAIQSFSVSIKGDELYEKNESLLLAFSNVNNGQTGAVDTLELIIRNDDEPVLSELWINELHYQNAGPDSNEFIEIAINPGSPVKAANDVTENLVLTLYNGANGEEYLSFTGDDFSYASDSVSSYDFLIVDAEGIQNGNPDGISLSSSFGEVLQFISYGGSFTAADGPAAGYESLDIAVVETDTATAAFSLSLEGSGSSYNEFSWAVSSTSTKGTENANQQLLLPISTEEDSELAGDFQLHQNYPNPFNPSTVISYQVPVNSDVSLKVFDLLGREVATLVNGRVSAGEHQVQFDASALSSGIYIYQLSTQAGEQTMRKMLLLK